MFLVSRKIKRRKIVKVAAAGGNMAANMADDVDREGEMHGSVHNINWSIIKLLLISQQIIIFWTR